MRWSVRVVTLAGALGAAWHGFGCGEPPPSTPDYGAIFETDEVVTWTISLAHDAWLSLVSEPKRYVPASVRVGADLYPDVGLRYVGSTDPVKPSLRVRFNAFVPDLTFHGVKRVNLHANRGDPTLVRERLASILLQRAGIPTPRTSLVRVDFDGKTSVYTLVEQVDRKFLEDRFGEDGGNLYRLERGAVLRDEGDVAADYDPARYRLLTEENGHGRQDLVDLVRVLNRTPIASRRLALEEVLDVDELVTLWAAHAWMVNLDSYLGTGDNLYLYRDLEGRFHAIPWRFGRSFANYRGSSCAYSTDELIRLLPSNPTCGGPRPLVDSVLSVPALRGEYVETLARLTRSVFRARQLEEDAESLRALLASGARRSSNDLFSAAESDASFTEDLPPGDNPARIPGLLPFIETRSALVEDWLDAE